MADERPWNWNWVDATGKCNALTVFGELKGLAATAIDTRNRQLAADHERRRFYMREPDGLTFSVALEGVVGSGRIFKIDDDLRTILLLNAATGHQIASYTVRLDDAGACCLFQDSQPSKHWQVLKAALEELFFGA